MQHYMQRLRVSFLGNESFYSVGCGCGWKHPSIVRGAGSKQRARLRWDEHMAAMARLVSFSDQT